MIYRSNLVAPDLTPHFKHLISRVMGHSFGHDVLSDWADKSDDDPVFGHYKNCGLWTHDEAALLYNVAKQVGGDWLDIGSHTGWTAAHTLAAGALSVDMVDPMYELPAFRLRAFENDNGRMHYFMGISQFHQGTSAQYFFRLPLKQFDGVVIDGDHEPGEPLHDAMNAAAHLKPGGVILLHDFVGLPVREAVRYLMAKKNMNVRLYLTPHVVAVCWRDGWTPPPAHRPDPFIVSQDLPARWPEFDWRPFIAPEPE